MEHQMESQKSSVSSAAADSSPGIQMDELKQCKQMIRQLMERREEDDKTLKCLTVLISNLEKCQKVDKISDEPSRRCQEQNQNLQKDADKKIEEGQQKLREQDEKFTQYQELLDQKMAEMTRMIEEGQQNLWQQNEQFVQLRKEKGQEMVGMIRMIEKDQQKVLEQYYILTHFKEQIWQKLAEMTRTKPRGRKLPNELCVEIVNAMQYIQKRLNKLPLTPNNFWDKYHTVSALSFDHLTITLANNVSEGAVRAKLPIPECADGIFYFEIFFKKGDGYVDIGLRRPVGLRPDKTCMFSCLGELWMDSDRNFAHIFGGGNGFGVGHWVGCGVHMATRQLFFTRNGKFLGIAAVLPTFEEPTNMFPSVTFLQENAVMETIVETNFGGQPFKWQCTDADLAMMANGDGPTSLNEHNKQRMAREMEKWKWGE